jgi:hypothetical protein
MVQVTTKKVKKGIVDRATGTTEIQAVFLLKIDTPKKSSRVQYQSLYRSENTLIFFNVGDLDMDNVSGAEIELDGSGFVLSDALAESGKGTVEFVIRLFESEHVEIGIVPLSRINNKGVVFTTSHKDCEVNISIFEVKPIERGCRRFQAHCTAINKSNKPLEYVRMMHTIAYGKNEESEVGLGEAHIAAGAYADLGPTPIEVPKKSSAESSISIELDVYKCADQIVIKEAL